MKVGVAVGDEALHTVQPPAIRGLVPSGFKTHGLQVTAGVGFGEVHRAGGSLVDAGQIFVFQLFTCELLYCLGAVLQSPDGGETHVGSGYHLGGHNLHHSGEVQSVVFAFQGHAVQSRLDKSVEVLAGAGGIHHTAVYERRTYMVNLLGVGGYHITGNIAKQFHHCVVLFHGFFGVGWSFGMDAGLGIVLFFHSNHLLHVGMMQVETKILVICVKIHNLLFKKLTSTLMLTLRL